MRIVFILFSFLFLLTTTTSGTEDRKEGPVVCEIFYVGDNAFNLSGGLSKGYRYLGVANMDLSLDTKKIGLWKGGRFFIHGACTHGGTPSETLYGDIQTASNIEAGNHTYLQECWYKQQIRNVEMTFGLQDLNCELANSENGGIYLNSSFGIMPTFSMNMKAPIFPLTTVGLTVKWKISKKLMWINSVYDGSPTYFDNNPYNVKWEWKNGDGLLWVTELQHVMNIGNMEGTYKIGAFSHNHEIEKYFKKNIPDSLDQRTFGVYAIADQNIWKAGEKNISAFVQIGYSPSKRCSRDNLYFGFGVNATGFFSKSENDVLGIALAHACLAKDMGCETAIEFTWQKPISNNFYIQPDLQYIIHPSGNQSGLANVVAPIVRFGFNF